MGAFLRAAPWRALVMVGLAGLVTACEGSPGEKGAEGAPCTVKDNGDNTKTVVCGGSTVTVVDGKPGTAGSGCTIKDNTDGSKTITCDGKDVTLTDGKAGTPGTAGKDGTDGADCSVKDNSNGTKTISCGDGTVVTLADGQTGTVGKDGTNGTNGKPCTVKDNANGTKTISCDDGTTVTVNDGKVGPTGLPGAPGAAGSGVEITKFHGMANLLSTGQFLGGAKFFVTASITAATADEAGLITLKIKLLDSAGKPFIGQKSLSATINKLAPPAAGIASSDWVPYLFSKATTAGKATGGWPAADGTIAFQPSTESANVDPTKGGTLTDNGDGTYVYVFKNKIANLTTATDGTSVLPKGATKYERNLLHRVGIQMGGSVGATADAWLDFVPDGTVNTSSRAVVETDTCKQCHGPLFKAHGGNRLHVETCTLCHNPSLVDPESGNNLDLKVMLHKIHAGSELASIPGADGLTFDDPSTVANEAADNGKYNIWGYNKTKFDWSKVGFPAVLDNCTKCHQGKGAQVDNWKKVPSRAACGSCHDTTNFETGVNHTGGKQLSDAACSACHSDAGMPASVADAHDWTLHDQRNIPEFTVDFTVSTPLNGKFFVKGESPVISIVAKDNGVAIDHTTLAQDVTAEGCLEDACPPRDGLFTNASLFVHGPRAKQMPVLSYNARANVQAGGLGPFDLSAAGSSLILKIDNGRDVWTKDVTGGDISYKSNIVVAVPATGSFADKTQASATEIAAWLNADAAFKARAIAYIDEVSKRLAIRSRNLGPLFAVQLLASDVATKVFAGDLLIHTVNFSTVANKFMHTVDTKGVLTPTKDDPKVTWTKEKVTYTLDPVDDLAPGTYAANIELADRGNIAPAKAPVGQPAAVYINYKTPTVARVQFQVGQEAVEKPIADNCSTCHVGPSGKGFVLDNLRHNKLLDDGSAADLCAACHDQQPQGATGTWSGAKPISKRVHAIHYGSSLNFPLATVDYSNGDPVKGRNWDITLPQDVRNCEVCHTAKTSGTWAKNPQRLACSGCHDSLASQAHIKLQTLDPTPADPYSGDESESCSTCH